MKKLAAIAAALLLPLPALAIRVDNCDNVPHQVTVQYSNEAVTLDLAPGQSRLLPGIPLELRAGKTVRRPVDYDDEWCVWPGKGLHIQKRNSQRRG